MVKSKGNMAFYFFISKCFFCTLDAMASHTMSFCKVLLWKVE